MLTILTRQLPRGVSVLSESELRAHLARLLLDEGVTWMENERQRGAVSVVSVADATRVFTRWLQQQEKLR